MKAPVTAASAQAEVDGGGRPGEPRLLRLDVRAGAVIGLFKTECIGTSVFHGGPYKTLADIEYATAGWVDWYNHRRLHGSIGMVPLAEFEQAHYAALNPQEQPV